MWYCPTPRRTVADPTVVLSDNKIDVNANISNDHIPEPRCDQSSYITHETFYYYFISSIQLCSYTLLYGNDPARAAISVNLSMIYRFSSDTKTRATATRLFDYPTRSFVHSPCPVVIFTRPVASVAVIREIAFCRRSQTVKIFKRLPNGFRTSAFGIVFKTSQLSIICRLKDDSHWTDTRRSDKLFDYKLMR